MAYNNGYYGNLASQNAIYGNQFYGGQVGVPNQNMQQPKMSTQEQFIQPIYKQPIGLQGKSVDNIEVVKAMDIPLDGSVSFFPLVDGSAIVTKQLQTDGTSKIVIYKPTEDTSTEIQKYITPDELKKELEDFNIKDDFKELKRQVQDLIDDVKDLQRKKEK